MRITANNSVAVTVTAAIILILSIGVTLFGFAAITATTLLGAVNPLGEIGTLIYAGTFISGAIATTLAILVIKKAVTHYL